MGEEEKQPLGWRDDRSVVVLAGLLAIVAGGMVLGLAYKLGALLFVMIDRVDPGDAEAIRGVGWVFGALVGGVVAAGFGVWRAMIAGRATRAAEAQVTRQQDRDYADLFTKAVEQLGATREVREWDEDAGREVYRLEPNIEVRLGAIYALERISQDSERDHIAVMETLCAYVRENAPVEECENFEAPMQRDGLEGDALQAWWDGIFRGLLKVWIEKLRAPRVDIQAVVTVLGRRKAERVKYEIGRDERNPIYRLNLKYSALCKADMRKGDFRNAIFSEARMQGANLWKAQMQGADLEQARVQGANLKAAQMQGTVLRKAQMQGANLKAAQMQKAVLGGAQMQGANLWKAQMQGANLLGAQMQGANLWRARMQGANLWRAQMQGAVLWGAQMQGAVLGKAHFQSTRLNMVNIALVIASFTDFTDAVDLSQEAVNSCFGCAGTMLPEGRKRPVHWHPERLEDWNARNEAYESWKAARGTGEKPPWVEAADWTGW